MYSGEKSVLYPEILQDHFDRDGQRIGCTAAHADDVMCGGVELIEIDPFKQHSVAIRQRFAGRADKHIFSAPVEVRLCACAYRSPSCTIHYEVDTQGTPVGYLFGGIVV